MIAQKGPKAIADMDELCLAQVVYVYVPDRQAGTGIRREWPANVGFLDGSGPVKRPHAQGDPAENVGLGHRPVGARVQGVHAIVPHEVDVPVGDVGGPQEGRVGHAVIHVALPLLLAVHEEHAVPHGDRVAGNADDALDGRGAVVGGLEEYNVAPPGFGETVGELHRQHAVPRPQGGIHAVRGDAERLGDERPDEAEDQEHGNERKEHETERPHAPLLGGAWSRTLLACKILPWGRGEAQERYPVSLSTQIPTPASSTALRAMPRALPPRSERRKTTVASSTSVTVMSRTPASSALVAWGPKGTPEVRVTM